MRRAEAGCGRDAICARSHPERGTIPGWLHRCRTCTRNQLPRGGVRPLRWLEMGCSAAHIRTTGVIDMATLYLMVGLPCSGKTTLARTLEYECSALRLTPDEWQLRLFGQDAEEPEHNARHALIEALLWDVASRALVLGTNVILDFGFWAREEREDYRSRAKQLGASSEVHFLDVPDAELLWRLVRRNAQRSPMAFHITEEMMKPWIAFFQKPTLDELERRE
jgi:predicted kinase